MRFYDRLGERYDWFSFYESKAKRRALQFLELAPGQWVLNVGLGTGKEHLALQAGVVPGGLAFGLDLSPRMLEVAYRRTGAPLCRADGGSLPFAPSSFDRLFCAYVLDLVPTPMIHLWLEGFWRVLKPGGRIVLLSLTEGVSPLSRTFVRLWKLAYALNPVACGGCRPLLLEASLRRARFVQLQRAVVVQFGVPSEVLVAQVYNN